MPFVLFIDPFLIAATVQRFIKFIMYKKYYDFPVVRNFCGIMDVIPIAPYDGRDAVAESLAAARQKLQNGDIVCIFAEGKITCTGDMNPFRPGLETIILNSAVEITVLSSRARKAWRSLSCTR